mmetsp:Transcript_68724/g.151350  ORF Transcript_68724/g.151350 Transcript_68724/m.151350 type:complete len:285 (+) Transcript_68724:442-1296(+)
MARFLGFLHFLLAHLHLQFLLLLGDRLVPLRTFFVLPHLLFQLVAHPGLVRRKHLRLFVSHLLKIGRAIRFLLLQHLLLSLRQEHVSLKLLFSPSLLLLLSHFGLVDHSQGLCALLHSPVVLLFLCLLTFRECSSQLPLAFLKLCLLSFLLTLLRNCHLFSTLLIKLTSRLEGALLLGSFLLVKPLSILLGLHPPPPQQLPAGSLGSQCLFALGIQHGHVFLPLLPQPLKLLLLEVLCLKDFQLLHGCPFQQRTIPPLERHCGGGQRLHFEVLLHGLWLNLRLP